MAQLTDLTLADLAKAMARKEASAALRPARVRSVRAAIVYSTTFGTVKKPPAFLSLGST